MSAWTAPQPWPEGWCCSTDPQPPPSHPRPSPLLGTPWSTGTHERGSEVRNLASGHSLLSFLPTRPTAPPTSNPQHNHHQGISQHSPGKQHQPDTHTQIHCKELAHATVGLARVTSAGQVGTPETQGRADGIALSLETQAEFLCCSLEPEFLLPEGTSVFSLYPFNWLDEVHPSYKG